MALWLVLQPLFIIAIIIFLTSQWIYPLWTNQSTFPWFRKKKVLQIMDKREEVMSAERALDLVNFHCIKALQFIAVAESYAENEEKEAKEKLEKALQTMEAVKERAQKIKTITPKKEGI